MPTISQPPEFYSRADDGSLDINLHDGQALATDSDKRFVVILAGTQSGKTVTGPVWLWLEMALRGPGDYLVVSPSFTLLATKALPEFLYFFDTLLKLGEFIGSPTRKFTLSKSGEKKLFGRVQPRPTVIYFGHAADPDSLESATVKAAWLDEAGQSKFKLGSWEAILRRLSIHQGRILITTTPYTLGWLKQKLYDNWEKAKRNHPEIDIINFPSTMNPAFPQPEYDRAKADLPGWRFRMMYDGVFERPAGLIFDCFDRDKHVRPRQSIPDAWERFVGLDFGGINTAAVFWAKEPCTPPRYWAYREYWPRVNRTAKEHVAALLKGEPRIPTAVGGSGSEDQWRKEFAAAGLSVREPPVKDVEVGINRAYGFFQRGELVIFDDLEYTLDELGTYSRVLDDAGEPTEKIEDKESFHLIDSCRYLFSWLDRSANRFDVGTSKGKTGSVLDSMPSTAFT